MDLRQLRHFLTVVERGSFSAAAAALNVSQPSLSMSVKALEEEIGDTLLLRGPRGVSLVPMGTAFYEYASSIVREADKALEEMQVLKGAKRGRVTVGISAVYSQFLAPEALNAFHRLHPGVQITTDVSTHLPATAVEKLAQGAWDFGVLVPVSQQSFPDSVAIERLSDFPSAVYAAARHPLGRKRAITLKDLAAYDWVAGSWNLTGALLQRLFESRKLTAPRIGMVSSSFELLREFIASSNSLCLLPRPLAKRDVAAGRLIELRQNHIVVKSPAALVWPSRTKLTPAAARLMQEFRQAAAAIHD